MGIMKEENISRLISKVIFDKNNPLVFNGLSDHTLNFAEGRIKVQTRLYYTRYRFFNYITLKNSIFTFCNFHLLWH